MPQSPADALAALRDGQRYRSHPADRPRRLKLDSGPSLEWPGSRVLADVYVRPYLCETREVYRSGGALLVRPLESEDAPTVVDVADLVAELRAQLGALPEHPEAGRPYRDLRLLVDQARRATLDEYLRDVVLQLRRRAPVWRPSAEHVTVERPPAQTAAQRVAAHRERRTAAERASAAEFLAVYLEDAVPGERVIASDLYARAAEAIEDWDEDELPAPGSRTFYAVADEILGARTHSHGARFYTIPKPPEEAPVIDNLREDTLVLRAYADEAERALAAHAQLEALLEQRDRLGAPIVDELAARRARRSA